jgi:hypothetical protein
METNMNRKFVLITGASLAMAMGSNVFAANANVTQKGSLLIWPRIDVTQGTSTWIRLVNDGPTAVRVKCYFMNEKKDRNDFEFDLTHNDPVIFNAKDGYSPEGQTGQAFPTGARAPFTGNSYKGELVCFAVNSDGTALIRHNNLAGTATVAAPYGASEYNAWSFRYSNGPEDAVVGTGDLLLNGTNYDSCPAYLLGQFSPKGTPAPTGGTYGLTYVDISSCRQDLRQDYVAQWTKLLFDVYEYDEDKRTGAYVCSNSFIETVLDPASTNQNPWNGIIHSENFRKDAQYYRVTGIASTQCNRFGRTYNTGLVGVQTSVITTNGVSQAVSAELHSSSAPAVGQQGNLNFGTGGFVKWDSSVGISSAPAAK